MFFNENHLTAVSSLLLYILIYNIALSAMLATILSLNKQTDSIPSLFSSTRNVYLNLSISTILFSLAGIPPMGGFFAKVALLTLVLNEFFLMWFIVVISILLFGIFFYLSNLRYLFSYDRLTMVTAVTPLDNLTWTTSVVLFLLSGVLFYDDLILAILWLLL